MGMLNMMEEEEEEEERNVLIGKSFGQFKNAKAGGGIHRNN